MSEQITFSSPIEPPKVIFRITLISFDWQHARIDIHLRDFDPTFIPPSVPVIGVNNTAFGDKLIIAQYSGPEALLLMTQLNKINLSTQSLHQRVMNRLVLDGKIPPGTLSGSAD